MSKLTKALTAAAGNAGGDNLYVEDVFSTYLYTGNSSTQTITNDIDLAGEGGLVWLKKRNGASNNIVSDTERGITNTLNTDGANAQNTLTSTAVSSVQSDGFTLQNNGDTNQTGGNYASWTFRKAEKFFDVVTYTGDGVDPMSVPHNLGVTPGCVIIKRTDTTADWQVMFPGLIADGYGGTGRMRLNTTAAYAATGWTSIADSTHITIPTNLAEINASGGSYVAYLFASDAGGFGDDGSENIIKCGSYTAAANSVTGIDIDLGFEPQWILQKNASGSSTTQWMIADVMRVLTVKTGTSYPEVQVLRPNGSDAESDPGLLSINSTGFTSHGGFSTGDKIIYIAIRRPMKTPEAGTEVFNGVLTYSDNSTTTGFPVDIGFPVDLAWVTYTTLGAGALWMHRLTGLTSNPQPGKGKLAPYDTSAEYNSGELWGGDNNTGYRIYGHTYQRICYGFKRATGFFDVVAYSGDGVARTVNHNLGVVPEMMIVKRRSTARQWLVYTAPTGNTKGLFLNLDVDTNTFTGYWNDTTPTASVFTLGNGFDTNSSGDTYIAYLFASLAGVSKVGSYTGTGSNVDVDCGFSAGARFVLIKRTDSTGDWYYWDSVRGIVAGNDPYLLLNSTATEVTSTDYIDPLSSGFTVTSSAPAALNASGGTYIFLAIA